MISNSFIHAKLLNDRKIHIFVFTSIPRPQNVNIHFIVDNEYFYIKDVKQSSMNGMYIFEINLPFDFPYGKNVSLNMTYFGDIAIDITNSVDFPSFDKNFNYDGELGAIYRKEATTFNLWAPLATNVVLKIENSNKEFEYHVLERMEKGVYRLTLKGDYQNARYHYIVTNSGVSRETSDPYAFGTSFDSEYSAVVDLSKVNKIKKVLPTNIIEKPTDATIYELHIRDFTEGRDTNIVNKGKYLGVVEENRTSSYGSPVALDYLKYLGVSHIQLQPVWDFKSHDRINPAKEYNWGYEPLSMFSLEGQYSIHPEDPLSRILEFREMVEKLHKNNIRVVLDVVYNHMYEEFKRPFEAVVPNYFFRKRPNGIPSNASGCGNDFSSERYMGRKAIVDSCIYMMKVLDVDGIRFDLMGLLDIKTIKALQKEVRLIKKDALLYGEGWNMGNELKFEEKACADNAFQLKGIGFFNDSFRDIIKGPTFSDSLHVKGFVNGNFDYCNGYAFSFLGSVCDYCFPQKYLNASQSINYVECHDNNTLFDKLCASNPDEDKATLYKRVKLANALTVLSFGVPFIHMGQEIGQSKFGLDNTYNVPIVNNFDYKGLSERFDMVTYLKSVISLRKNELSFLNKIDDPQDIAELCDFETRDGLFIIKSKDISNISPYKEILFIINVQNESIAYTLNDYHRLLFRNGGIMDRDDVNVLNALIPPISIDVLVIDEKRKGKKNVK